jgi:hypothetical protein
MRNKLVLCLIILVVLFLVGCDDNLPIVKESLDDCVQLSMQLEFGLSEKGLVSFPINGVNREVGGSLLEISESYGRMGTDTPLFRTLTFQGYSKKVKLIWRGLTEDYFPYELGKFYKFDTINIRMSGALSNVFMDSEKQLLKEANCK